MDAKDANTSAKKSLLDRPVSLFIFISVIVVIGFAAFALGLYIATSNLTGDAAWIVKFREWRAWNAGTPDFIENFTMNMTRCSP